MPERQKEERREARRLTIEFAGDTPIYPSENGGWVRYSEHLEERERLEAELAEARAMAWECGERRAKSEAQRDEAQAKLAKVSELMDRFIASLSPSDRFRIKAFIEEAK